MGFFGFIAFWTGTLALWIAFWRAYYRLRDAQDEVHFVTTTDGWRIALSRFRPAASVPARRHPVVLCPGLGANRFSFHASPSSSLARTLAEHGYDCWVMEMRGVGLSERPNPFLDTHYGWTLDDHVSKDVPAALQKVLAVTGAPQAHFIGHSMGGITLYLSLIRNGEAHVRSGIAIGSSLDYSGTGSHFDALIKLKPVVSWLPAVPVGAFAAAMAPLSGRFPNVADDFMYKAKNTDPLLYRRFISNAYDAVSGAVFWQLETAFSAGGLRSADGALAYSTRLAEIRTPVFAITGSEDRQCSPSAARRTLEALGSRDKQFVEHPGQAHLDLVIGRDAPKLVFPAILEWLERWDHSTQA